MLEQVIANQNVSGGFVFSLRDNPAKPEVSAEGPSERSYGLLRIDGSVKPAGTAVSAVLASREVPATLRQDVEALRLQAAQSAIAARQLNADLHRAVRDTRRLAEEAGNLFGFVGVEVDPSRHFGNLEEVELGVAAGTVNITLTQGYIIKTTDRDILGRLDNLENEQLRFFVFRNNRPVVVSASEAQSLAGQGSQRVWVADLNQELPGNEAEANRQRFGYLKNNLSFEEFVFLTTYPVSGHNPQSAFFRFTDNAGREILTDWQLLHSGKLAFFDRITGSRVSNPIKDLDYAIFFTPAGSGYFC